MEKPDVDSIEGLSPAVAIEQKNPTKTSRSTVGTATEIYDYLRLMWARIGRTFCPRCGREMRPDTGPVGDGHGAVACDGNAICVDISAQTVRKVTHDGRDRESARAGFLRVSSTGRQVTRRNRAQKIDLTSREGAARRRRPAVGGSRRARPARGSGRHAFREGDGESSFSSPTGAISARWHDGRAAAFTDRFECANDGTRAPAPTPQLFSFNNPRGACPRCNGSARCSSTTNRSSFPIPSARFAMVRSIRGRSRATRTSAARSPSSRRRSAFRWTCRGRELSVAQRQMLLTPKARGYIGIFPFLVRLEEKRYKQYIRVFLRQYQTAQECPAATVRSSSRNRCNVRVGGRTIAQVSRASIDSLSRVARDAGAHAIRAQIAETILRESRDRVRFLRDVGLELSHARPLDTDALGR